MASVRNRNRTRVFDLYSLSLRRLLALVGTFSEAVNHGGRAAHTYHALVRRGATHQAAVARIFDEYFDRL